PTYQVRVVAAPTFVVRSVEYEYPLYTGLAMRRVDQLGDIKAIEGTRVTIRGQSNHALKNATIDWDCDGHADTSLSVSGQDASATFTLRLKKDRSGPEHNCYQVVITTTEGHHNPQPIRHQIEVTPDL